MTTRCRECGRLTDLRGRCINRACSESPLFHWRDVEADLEHAAWRADRLEAALEEPDGQEHGDLDDYAGMIPPYPSEGSHLERAGWVFEYGTFVATGLFVLVAAYAVLLLWDAFWRLLGRSPDRGDQ